MLVLIVLGISNQVYSQNGWLNKKGEVRFGGPQKDEFTCMVKTEDGGYLFGGYSDSPIGSHKSQGSLGWDYWIVKTDANFNRLWDKTYGGTQSDYLYEIVGGSNGTFFLVGVSDSPKSGNKGIDLKGTSDIWCVKIDQNGNKLWEEALEGNATGADRFISGAIGTRRGEYNEVYVLYNLVIPQNKQIGCRIVRFTEDPNAQQQVWYSSDSYNNSLEEYHDIVYWQSGTDLKGFVIGGSKEENGNKQFFTRWLKWGTNNDLVSDYTTIYRGNDLDVLTNIVSTSDGGYLLVGISESEKGLDKSNPLCGSRDGWVIKISSTGTKLWDRTYGGPQIDNLTTVVESIYRDGFYLGGTSNSYSGCHKGKNTRGGYDFWALKIDNWGGITAENTFGGSGNDELWDIEIASDGSCLLAGLSNSEVSGEKELYPLGATDFWMIKASISLVGLEESNFSDEKGVISVYHDQTKSSISIKLNDALVISEPMTLEVTNVLGQVVYQQNQTKSDFSSNHLEIQSLNFPAGVYHLRLNHGNESYVEKFIIER